jgi:hypothetical protein
VSLFHFGSLSAQNLGGRQTANCSLSATYACKTDKSRASSKIAQGGNGAGEEVVVQIATLTKNSTSKVPTVDSDLRRTTWFLVSMGVIGVGALVLWATSRTPSGAAGSTFALGLLLLGGAALVGGVLGLLFGIPKSVSDPVSVMPPPKSEDAAAETTESSDVRARSSYAVNTNLEQISDWLTKIIVGVGLTQISTIQAQFQALAAYFGKAFGEGNAAPLEPSAPVIAALIITYGLTAGFLAGYLLTRMFLPGAFVRADDALRQRNSELRTQIAKQEEVAETAGRMQGEIYNDLYRYNEQGFRDAIVKIDNLLRSPVHTKNPALWVYLAAAHGQAWRWENEHISGPSDAKTKVLEQHRLAALTAAKKALEFGDSWKPILQMMWDKDHPVKKDGVAKDEDDLEVFYDDRDFKDLLGN